MSSLHLLRKLALLLFPVNVDARLRANGRISPNWIHMCVVSVGLILFSWDAEDRNGTCAEPGKGAIAEPFLQPLLRHNTPPALSPSFSPPSPPLHTDGHGRMLVTPCL